MPTQHLGRPARRTHHPRRRALLALAAATALAVTTDAAAQTCNNTTGSVVEKPRLFIGGLNKGVNTMSFSGTAQMPHLPQIDLTVSGARFVVEDAQGDPVIDATIAPGLYDPVTKHGWRANGRGGFFYKNNGPTLNDGLFSLTVNELRAAPGTFQFRLKAKDGTYPVQLADLPLRVTLILDPPSAATTGQCTEAQYTDECRFNKSSSTLRCKPAV